MFKKGYINTSWQKRWLCLESQGVVYYKRDVPSPFPFYSHCLLERERKGTEKGDGGKKREGEGGLGRIGLGI